MTSPLPFPEWVPWWVHLVVLLGALLFALLFLLMPFSVFGVKARLEGIEVRLDEIQGEIRSLALRLPEPGGMDDAYTAAHAITSQSRAYDLAEPRPPIPPATYRPATYRDEPRIVRPGRDAGRTEPRLY